MEPFRTEKIDTPAGPYRVEIHQDIDPFNPLEEDESIAVLIEYNGYGARWDKATDTLNVAGNAGEILARLLTDHGHDPDAVGRRYMKWATIAKSPWVFAMGGQACSQSDYYRYVLLANSNDLPDVNAVIKNVMADYQTWAEGGIVGFVAKSPDGHVVESMWGFYSDKDAIEEARDYIEYDAKTRVENANLVGAGFMGLI